MSDFQYAIITHGRIYPLLSLNLLELNAVPLKQVSIHFHSATEFNRFAKVDPRILDCDWFVSKTKPNPRNARESVREYLQERYICLDDDIGGMWQMKAIEPGRLYVPEQITNTFHRACQSMFDYAVKYDAYAFGIPQFDDSELLMYRAPLAEIEIGKPFFGGMQGFVKPTDIEIPANVEFAEDVAMAIKYIDLGLRTIRFNTFGTTYSPIIGGGCDSVSPFERAYIDAVSGHVLKSTYPTTIKKTKWWFYGIKHLNWCAARGVLRILLDYYRIDYSNAGAWMKPLLEKDAKNIGKPLFKPKKPKVSRSKRKKEETE